MQMSSEKGKRGWESLGLRDLLSMLEGEVGELKEAIRDKHNPQHNIGHECIDIANFAMMLRENAQRIERCKIQKQLEQERHSKPDFQFESGQLQTFLCDSGGIGRRTFSEL